MGRKLSQEEFEEKIFNLFGDKYTVISQYLGKRQPITLHCNIHNLDFTVTAECFMRGTSDVRSSCPECAKDRRRKKQALCQCAYCGKDFYRAPSKLKNSLSGLMFCCREHKDLAQRLESGEQFKKMRPLHYTGVGTISTYRDFAFRHYSHCCANCGWDEDETILQVHHIDENRDNNNLNNLMILCPTCHMKLTSHRYILDENNKIKLKE